MLTEKVYEIMISSISVIHHFANIFAYLSKFEDIRFVSIKIWLVCKIMNEYLVTLEYLVYSDSHSNFETEGKIKLIAVA